MVNDSILSTPIIYLTQVPVFVLIIIVYGLGLSIMRDTVSSPLNCFSTCKAYFDGYIATGAINLFVLIALYIVAAIYIGNCWYSEHWSLNIVILCFTNLVFNLISEALFFKFAEIKSSCNHYFPNNAIVIARSSLVILLMILMLFFALLTLIHFLRHGKSRREKVGALFAPLLILPSIAMLVLNAILIAQLRPQLNHHINNYEPSSFRMGFFNSLEISQIKKEIYTKTATFDEQIIGNLSDVFFSPNFTHHTWEYQCRDFDYDLGSYGEYYTCIDGYTEYKYFYQISCSNQRLTFYKDCANASSLTIYVTSTEKYGKRYSTLNYDCHVNQANKTCASLCTQLLSNYQLILIQEFKPNHVQAAWAGLNNCLTIEKFQLEHYSSLVPCSRTEERGE
jgi:hypothetical protein